MASVDRDLIRTLDHWKTMGGVYRDLDLVRVPIGDLAREIRKIHDERVRQIYARETERLLNRVVEELQKENL